VKFSDAALRRSSANTRAKPACGSWNAKSPRSRARPRAKSFPKTARPLTVKLDAGGFEGLSRPRAVHFRNARRKSPNIGIATGLAWTPVGGDILFIEATRMRGRGNCC
jgi:ATP-dependent Lon protease